SLSAYVLVDVPDNLDSGSIGRVYRALAESKWQGTSPNRYGFVHLERLGETVIYGFFAHEFERELLDYDDSKTEIIKDEGDFARYLFLLDLGQARLLLQRRHRPYPSLPEWQTIFERLTDLLRYLFAVAQVPPPTMIVPVTTGES